ncbi:Uncharacterised protein [uncultured archaeon]|nr:Uncharacterised protein [uncultured archaeon]
MSIQGQIQRNERFKPIADFLKERAVVDATKVDQKFTFEKWKESKRGQTCIALYGEENAGWYYLDDCHDALDHTPQYHLKVFSIPVAILIEYVDKLFRGYDISKQRAKQDLKKETYAKLIELMTAYGLEEDKYSIKLKGVERR